MALTIQSPNDSERLFLNEVLLSACRGAKHGGGAFAFASAAGVKLLLEDKGFVTFAKRNPFLLIVGLDAITNTAAVAALQAASTGAKRLCVKAFLHDQDATFHPKFCWFGGGSESRLIVGSGNLTVGGLRGHWEAFSVALLADGELKSVVAQWDDWLDRHRDYLLDLEDPKVAERARENGAWLKTIQNSRTRTRAEKRLAIEADALVQTSIPPTAAVLIAEIPRGGGRWNQAGFDIENYETFFGAKLGTQRRVIFQSVTREGKLGDIESRPSVAVKSRNFRFELAVARGASYPEDGPPIGIFVRMAVRRFRYRLLLPRQQGHSIVDRYLRSVLPSPGREMRRHRLTAAELDAVWPANALVVN